MRFFFFLFNLNSATAYQQDTRYSSNYTQPDYNASQYGTSTDYNTASSDYPQTGAYDNRSYGGYGKSKAKFQKYSVLCVCVTHYLASFSFELSLLWLRISRIFEFSQKKRIRVCGVFGLTERTLIDINYALLTHLISLAAIARK